MMRHYCLLVGVAVSSDNSVGCESASSECDDDGISDVGVRLCLVGADSPIGFRDGRCTVLKKGCIQ